MNVMSTRSLHNTYQIKTDSVIESRFLHALAKVISIIADAIGQFSNTLLPYDI